MKKILFPTDFSKAAGNAFLYALHLADATGAAITTIHLYPRPEVKSGKLPRTLDEFYATDDLDELQEYKNHLPTLRGIQMDHGFAHISINHLLKAGKAVDGILQAAAEEEVELIVMGTTGASGLKELLLGSIAGEVLEKAPCPVLAVPAEARFSQISQVAFTISYQEEEGRALHKLIELMAPLQPQIHCVNVDLAHTDFHTHAMEKFRASFEGQEGLHFSVLDGNDIEEALTAFIQEAGIDLLAMIAHRRSFFERLFLYSRAKMMAYHTHTPILSIPADMLS